MSSKEKLKNKNKKNKILNNNIISLKGNYKNKWSCKKINL